MKFINNLLITILASTVAAKCGSDYGSCESNYCCSQYGYCGTTDAYCGEGCQSEFGRCNDTTDTETPSTEKTTTIDNSPKLISSDGTCGIPYGTVCPDNLCCSQYGYCGSSKVYCGEGCQPKYGRCNSFSTSIDAPEKTSTIDTEKTSTIGTTETTSSKPISTTDTTKITSTKPIATTDTTKTTSTKPISTNDLCGPSNGDTYCPNNNCCSKYGYCGTSNEHCKIEKGCQSEFGRCGIIDSNTNTNINTNIKLKYYYKCKNSKHWALTYDDGPYDYDLDLLDLLKKKGVKATFFINGNNVMEITSSKGKKIVQRMYNDGHVIGSHTWSHANLEEISESEIKSEMTKLENVLMDYIGKKPALMRPPYGAGDDNSYIAGILDSLGYTAAVMWNVDTLDWSTKGDIDYALSEFDNYFGQSLLSLNHCFYEGITKKSLLDLAEAEIDYVLSKGYTPVTVDVCLGLEPYQN